MAEDYYLDYFDETKTAFAIDIQWLKRIFYHLIQYDMAITRWDLDTAFFSIQRAYSCIYPKLKDEDIEEMEKLFAEATELRNLANSNKNNKKVQAKLYGKLNEIEKKLYKKMKKHGLILNERLDPRYAVYH